MTPPAATSGLADPPDQRNLTSGLPACADLPSELHRLSDWPGTWWFADASPEHDTGGRFNLPAPEGTCYLAETLEGALLEKLVRTPKRIVPAQRLLELFHTTVEVRQAPRLADLVQPLTGLGLNAEIHVTLDYRRTRQWAVAIRRAGWRGLRYLLRGDNALRQRGVALFGHAGLHRRAPRGLRTALHVIDVRMAATVLAARGVMVLPIPSADQIVLQHHDPGSG